MKRERRIVRLPSISNTDPGQSKQAVRRKTNTDSGSIKLMAAAGMAYEQAAWRLRMLDGTSVTNIDPQDRTDISTLAEAGDQQSLSDLGGERPAAAGHVDDDVGLTRLLIPSEGSRYRHGRNSTGG